MFLRVSEGLSPRSGLFPSRNVLFWLRSHWECFGEKVAICRRVSLALCCGLADKETGRQFLPHNQFTTEVRPDCRTPQLQDWLDSLCPLPASPPRPAPQRGFPPRSSVLLQSGVGLYKNSPSECTLWGDAFEFAILNVLLPQRKSGFLYKTGRL